jgi:hypothetical protein
MKFSLSYVNNFDFCLFFPNEKPKKQNSRGVTKIPIYILFIRTNLTGFTLKGCSSHIHYCTASAVENVGGGKKKRI